MLINVDRNHKAYLGWGEKERRGLEVGEEGDYIPVATLSPSDYQNDSYIKMRSDESHFNVSLGSDGQSQDSVHNPQPF